MTDALPHFTYHPDPIATGVIVQSGNVCQCCNLSRGFIYKASTYSALEDVEEALCPWCIASGAAAEKYEATFNDDHGLLRAGIPRAVIDEVTLRTPGFVSWQGERWLSHCNDACEFHGDLPRERLASMDSAGKAEMRREREIDDGSWAEIVEYYQPAGQPAIYVFRCRHCPRELYYMDYT